VLAKSLRNESTACEEQAATGGVIGRHEAENVEEGGLYSGGEGRPVLELGLDCR